MEANQPKRTGRPPSGQELRTAQVSFSLHPEDARWWAETAEAMGFASRSQLLTAITERMKLVQFQPWGLMKLGVQLTKRAGQRDLLEPGFTFYTPPLPPLPEEDPAPEDLKTVLAQINQELQKA